MQSSQRGRVCKKHVWCSFFSPFGPNALLKIFILKACTLEYDIYLRCRLLTKVLIWISGIFIIIQAYFCDRAASDVCRVFASFLANLFRPDDIQLSNPIKKKKTILTCPKHVPLFWGLSKSYPLMLDVIWISWIHVRERRTQCAKRHVL